MFLSASDAGMRQSQVRIVNRSSQSGEVRIEAFDDSGWTYEPLTLPIGVGAIVHFDSNDLEFRNGTSVWRLQVASDQPILMISLAESESGHLSNLSR